MPATISATCWGSALSWGAAMLGRRGPSDRFTYGYRSSSILAALANAIILLVVTGGIAWEALWRLAHPVPVTGGLVACGGGGRHPRQRRHRVAVHARPRKRPQPAQRLSPHGRRRADRVGVVVVGLAIALTGWLWLDPAIGLVISAVIVYGTWDLVKQSVRLALDAVPQGVDAAAVRAHLLALPGVTALHDLHIWGMSTTETALTCHLVMPGGHPGDEALAHIADELEHRFGIHHATLQIELGDSDEVCALTPEHVV